MYIYNKTTEIPSNFITAHNETFVRKQEKTLEIKKKRVHSLGKKVYLDVDIGLFMSRYAEV